MPKDDRIRIQHMLDAAREALKSTQDRTRADLEQSPVWTLGLVKCVEIIGEAASHVTQDTRIRHPEVPWIQIVAMRHRLVHAYFDLDLDQVWKTVTEDLPPLVAELERVLAPRDEN